MRMEQYMPGVVQREFDGGSDIVSLKVDNESERVN